jgi:hypothetical protein
LKFSKKFTILALIILYIYRFLAIYSKPKKGWKGTQSINSGAMQLPSSYSHSSALLSFY